MRPSCWTSGSMRCCRLPAPTTRSSWSLSRQARASLFAEWRPTWRRLGGPRSARWHAAASPTPTVAAAAAVSATIGAAGTRRGRKAQGRTQPPAAPAAARCARCCRRRAWRGQACGSGSTRCWPRACSREAATLARNCTFPTAGSPSMRRTLRRRVRSITSCTRWTCCRKRPGRTQRRRVSRLRSPRRRACARTQRGRAGTCRACTRRSPRWRRASSARFRAATCFAHKAAT
mmetsp:Transcript_37587/g.111137  ORF Transcript_37587/g.111137 Transcript_37587/m.111137 type:complete len:232 (+) Transcript_37587:373-1068(+)